MLFVVSKIVGFFAIPSNLIISIGVIGLLLLLTRYARAGRRLAFGSLILLVIVGLSPLGNALIIPLEERFPAWDPASGPPAARVHRVHQRPAVTAAISHGPRTVTAAKSARPNCITR